MKMTHRWLKRCCEHFDSTPNKYGYNQTLFPIVQGSTYKDLKKNLVKPLPLLKEKEMRLVDYQ